MIAVETREARPFYTHLRCVPGFTKEAIRDYAKASLVPGTRVLSDGLSCWPGVAEAGMKHNPRVTGGGRPTDDGFKWVNTGLGNLKSAIAGTLRSIDERHTPRYLASFEWRYNRRFDLSRNVERLARVAVATAPHPYRTIAAVRGRPAETLG